MSKGLKALIKTFGSFNYYKSYEIIEKELKALEIIKKCCLVSAYPNNTYELAFTNKIEIDQEEYDLIKEVLYDEGTDEKTN